MQASSIALGVITENRSSLLTDVPTIADAGDPGFDYPIWYGVWVRLGTPVEVADKLAKDIARTLVEPDVRNRLRKHGTDLVTMTQSEFARIVVSEGEKAAHIAKMIEIKSP